MEFLVKSTTRNVTILNKIKNNPELFIMCGTLLESKLVSITLITEMVTARLGCPVHCRHCALQTCAVI